RTSGFSSSQGNPYKPSSTFKIITTLACNPFLRWDDLEHRKRRNFTGGGELETFMLVWEKKRKINA
ncbi:MAG: hypothetical protein JW915_05810, partial [Chitinispirillaceae bacterium]|nr:hypothetical protein [Chitinispirillaceae bacterium]